MLVSQQVNLKFLCQWCTLLLNRPTNLCHQQLDSSSLCCCPCAITIILLCVGCGIQLLWSNNATEAVQGLYTQEGHLSSTTEWAPSLCQHKQQRALMQDLPSQGLPTSWALEYFQRLSSRQIPTLWQGYSIWLQQSVRQQCSATSSHGCRTHPWVQVWTVTEGIGGYCWWFWNCAICESYLSLAYWDSLSEILTMWLVPWPYPSWLGGGRSDYMELQASITE